MRDHPGSRYGLAQRYDPRRLRVAGLLLAAFVWWEMRAPFPMLPMDLFRIRLFSAGSAAIGLSFALMIGFFVLQALYLQFVLGYDALETGLANLPLAVATVIVAPPSATLLGSTGRTLRHC